MKSHKLLRPIKINIFGLLALLLPACQSNTIYHSYQPAPLAGWSKSDTLVYTLPENIPTGSYEVEIGIRHRETYSYRNLWLTISQNMQDTLRYRTDTVEINLADETGNWKGDGPGGLYQYTCRYKSSLPIIAEGSARTFRIVQIMKDNPLKNISDVGIRLIDLSPTSSINAQKDK